MALAALSIDLNARLAGLQEGMDKAVRIAEKSTSQIEAKFGALKGIAAGVGGAFGAALSVQGITQLFRATIDGIDALNDLSDATGSSIENLSGLENVALRSGNSIESASQAVVKLNKALGDAKPGSEIEGVFKALGLSVKELKALDPAQALLQVSQALSTYADDGNKARAVQELFGKSLREIAPLLNDLAKAGQLNATVTTEQAKAAEKFNHEMAGLGKNVTDAARAIAGPLVTALNTFLTNARAASDETLSLGQRIEKLFNAARGIGFGALLPSGSSDELKSARESLAAIETALQRADLSAERRADLEQKRIGRLRTIAKLEGEAANAQKAAFRASQNYGERSLDIPGASKPSKAGKAKDADRMMAAAGLDEATLQALRAIEQTDANKIRELDAALDALFGMRASGTGSGPEIDEAIEKLRGDLEKLSPAARKAAEDKKRLDELLANTPTGALKEVLTDIELLNAAFAGGKIGVELWAEAVIASTDKLQKDTEKKAEEISEFAKEASRNIQDALGDAVLQTLEGDFDNIGKAWGNMLKRLVAQAIAADLASALLGKGYGSTTGQMGGWIGQLIGMFGGGGGGTMESYPGGSFGGAFADGGTLGAGKWGIAGERGPEIIKGPAQVVPMTGGGTIVNNFHGDVGAATLRAINLSQKQVMAQMRYRERF